MCGFKIKQNKNEKQTEKANFEILLSRTALKGGGEGLWEADFKGSEAAAGRKSRPWAHPVLSSSHPADGCAGRSESVKSQLCLSWQCAAA